MAVSSTARVRSRILRRNSTDAERELWRVLRSRRFAALKFRRQHAVGEFIADFACLERMLIIELDGGQHAIAATADRKRTRYLESHGFRVIRFWNNDVLQNPDGVMERILQEVSVR